MEATRRPFRFICEARLAFAAVHISEPVACKLVFALSGDPKILPRPAILYFGSFIVVSLSSLPLRETYVFVCVFILGG